MKLRIFVDGACSGNPGPGGWAAILLMADNKQIISGSENNTTNNRMELKAAAEALSLAIRLDFKRIDVYSDSAYVVDSITKGWLKKWAVNGWKTKKGTNIINVDLWQQLLNLLKHSNKINFIKIKGHSGHKYNELADKTAKKEVEALKAKLEY